MEKALGGGRRPDAGPASSAAPTAFVAAATESALAAIGPAAGALVIGQRQPAKPSRGDVPPRHQIRKDCPMMIPRTVVAFMLSLMLAGLAWAVPPVEPLDRALARADLVVVGKLGKLTPIEGEKWMSGAITVMEVLKGPADLSRGRHDVAGDVLADAS